MKIFRSLALPAGAALLVSLAACQQSESPTPQESPAAPTDADGAPDARPGISGSDGRLVLPVVAGRPAAVYFTVRNDGPAPATLAAVHVAGAGEAQMHKTEGGSMSAVDSLDIAPGASLEFAPGGLHVMAFDLDGSLDAGGNSELTLTFSDGDKLSMPLRIETMDGAMSGDHDMAGMQH